MTMTTESAAPRKRGRPFGLLGPRRRQQQLAEHFIKLLGGDANLTPLQEVNITRAVALLSFAEESRRQITKYGAQTVGDLKALVELEECAERAVKRLKLPTTSKDI